MSSTNQDIFPIPNKPPVRSIDFSQAYKYADFRTRTIPQGADIKSAVGCVDYNETDNTWTVKSTDNPAWMGSLWPSLTVRA